MLYTLHELAYASAAPYRFGAQMARQFWTSPLNPMADTALGRTAFASAELFESVTRRYGKPGWGLETLTINDHPDMRRILTEPEANLIRQHQALMATEEVTLIFTDEAIDALADAAVAVNASVENIGARRLQTILEKVVEEISFTAADRGGETVTVDAAYVQERVGALAANADLSRFIL